MGLESMRFHAAYKLEEIDENRPANSTKNGSVLTPETPTESMEFLARSWSVSATELSKALSTTHALPKNLDKPTFNFLDHHLEVENPITSKDNGVEPRRSGDSPQVSRRTSDGTKELFILHQALHPEFLTNQQLLKNGVYRSIIKGKTMGRRLKDQKERKKHETRTQNAELHAAVSVAGVAAAVAALTASNATLAETTLTTQHTGTPKTPAAIASAAALVASHCLEIADEMGAHRDQILAAVNSAINARTNGDVITLTAAAATALRGASTLKARLQKGYGAAGLALGDQAEHLNCMTAMNFVTRGGELLKHTRKGDLHWKQVSFSINSTFQVVVKLKSRYMAGAFIKKKNFIVSGVHSEIPAWRGKEPENDDVDEKRDYFGVQTAERVIQFECKNKSEKQMWIDGIHHLLHCRVSTPFP